ncbi:MAG: ATP synthase F1 subunit epsilon [Terriglobales bacterium]
MDTFELEIATPQRMVWRAPATEAEIPGFRGYLGALPGHAPLIGELGIGEMSWRDAEGKIRRLVVGGGFMEIQPDKVMLLADSAEWPGEIDPARAQAALEQAEERQRRNDPEVDHVAATRAVLLARARLASRQRHTQETVHH